MRSRNLLLIAAVGSLLPAAAQAQWYSSYPQQGQPYGYGVQQAQPYAIEVAPNTYVIRRPGQAHRGAQVLCVKNCGDRDRHKPQHTAKREAPKSDRPHKPANRALIEELERRSEAKRHLADSGKIVRDKPVIVREKPVVIVHRRVVEEPPRVVVRHYVPGEAPTDVGVYAPPRESAAIDPPPPHHARVKRATSDKHPRREAGNKRVIHAEAEVTILGPDRMSIRLYRKRPGEADTEVQ
jgi:hypothetical protein